MFHLYHLVPRNFEGNTLYPLNMLRNRLPEVYEAHARKYEGREMLLTRRVPLLDCLWNDVLHFSPVHPEQIRDALRAVGYEWEPRRWFAVDPAACGFDAGNTVVYLYPARGRGDFATRDEDYIAYDPALLEEVATLPQATAAYYAEAVAVGAPIFVFHRIAHILHRGSIECNRVKALEV
ncbi:MAG: hypothetical protein R3272_03895 [Candidatus Promineifilaceae bacterium]|nr:hypothetical protein [Candidatus Promineifilaceae bacterium]